MLLTDGTAARPDVHGVVVVDKPPLLTSFDIVAQARKRFGTRRVGHAGTLDPMATGVLLVLLGEATKLADALSGAYKTYEAELVFGRSTDTLDAQGRTVDEIGTVRVSEDALQLALQTERLRKRQLPPQHSALKVGGQRAYALARAGQEVSLAERNVDVRRLELVSRDEGSARVLLHVSKGYYVRAFARDVCETLGVPGHLSALQRTESGGFEISEAVTWPPAASPRPLSLASAARRALPGVTLTDEGVVRARHGKVLGTEHFQRAPDTTGTWAWFDNRGALVALGVNDVDGFRVRRGFVNR